MFENLSERLDRSFKLLKGEGKITEINVAETLKDVRKALLDADVNYKVAKSFTDTVKEKALGQNVLTSVKPSQLMVKIVHDELASLMGGTAVDVNLQGNPAIILMSGLQGSGKTTFTGKLASLLKTKKNKKPLLAACDVYRPAAIEQLRVVGEQVGVPVYMELENKNPVEIAMNAIREARAKGNDVVIVDTAGRLAIDEQMMNEIAAIKEAIHPNETLFVVDAMTGQDAVTVAQTFDEALGIDGVLIAEPIAGSSGQELALQLKKRHCMAVLLLAAPEHADAAAALLEQSGVLVLPIDAPESLIVQTIRLLAAVRIQLEQMQHKTEKLEAKVADIRIINRAKLLLVQHLQMTETEAHKYIEKQAMDTSMRRRTIAENIIRTYED